MSKDNLENFFRKRAEGHSYQYREGDWRKLEAGLNALPIGIPLASKLQWMATGALILAVLLALIWGGSKYFYSPLESGLDDIGNIQETQPYLETPPVEETPLNNNELEILNQDSNESANKGKIINKKSTENILNTTRFDTVKANEEDAGQLTPAEPYVNTIFIKQSEPGIDYYFEPFILDVEMMDVSGEDIFEFKQTFVYSLVGAMDFSGTNQSGLGQPKFRYGLAIEYYLLPQMSIGMGVNFTQKTYSANGREYSPPKGFWTNGIVPETTNAKCQILDIPIMLNFFQPIKNKSGLAMQAGISSWFMLKEKYYYHYVDDDPDLVRKWYGENENKYVFGVINLSLAYTYQFNKIWSLMAGPYVNFPLTGIGHGNVNLKSVGVKSSLRLNKYKLKRK